MAGKSLCRRRSHSLIVRTMFPWCPGCRSMAGCKAQRQAIAPTPPHQVSAVARFVNLFSLRPMFLSTPKLQQCRAAFWMSVSFNKKSFPAALEKTYIPEAHCFDFLVIVLEHTDSRRFNSSRCVPGYLLSACLPCQTRFRWWSPTSHYPYTLSTRPMKPLFWKAGNSSASMLEAFPTKP